MTEEEFRSRAKPDKNAVHYLRRGADLLEERGKNYDQPGGERSMAQAIVAFNAITGHTLSEAEGWFLMECVKNRRLFTAPGFHEDSGEDGVAYSALKTEAKSREKKQ